MSDCIFCKIIDGFVPSMKVYEDAYSLVIMDIAGDVDGHMLAIPKRHIKSIFDCDSDTLHHVMDAVKVVASRLKEKCGYDGVNLLNASGEAAGQSVGHFHIHIIPRKDGDGIDAWPQFEGAKEEISEIYHKIIDIQEENKNETL